MNIPNQPIRRRSLICSFLAVLTALFAKSPAPVKAQEKTALKPKTYRWRKLLPGEILRKGDKFGNFDPNEAGRILKEKLENLLDPERPAEDFFTNECWEMFDVCDPWRGRIGQHVTYPKGSYFFYWRKEEVV